MKEKDEIIETCECEHTHKNIIDKVRSMMPDEDTVYDVAELFKVFGDSTRTNILMALFESEMCVCDIGELLQMTKSAISHQLRILRQSNSSRRERSAMKCFIRCPTTTS